VSDISIYAIRAPYRSKTALNWVSEPCDNNEDNGENRHETRKKTDPLKPKRHIFTIKGRVSINVQRNQRSLSHFILFLPNALSCSTDNQIC
jgi:hypothetical protein